MDKERAYVGLERQPVVNVKNLERRPGKDELFCTNETFITTCIEPSSSRAGFDYDVSQTTKHLATKEFGIQAPLGTFVDLVVRIDRVFDVV